MYSTKYSSAVQVYQYMKGYVQGFCRTHIAAHRESATSPSSYNFSSTCTEGSFPNKSQISLEPTPACMNCSCNPFKVYLGSPDQYSVTEGHERKQDNDTIVQHTRCDYICGFPLETGIRCPPSPYRDFIGTSTSDTFLGSSRIPGSNTHCM